MKFLSNVDLVWHWGIFTRNVVLASWIVIALMLVLYLAGLIPLGRAPRLPRPRGGRLLASAATLALAVWLGSGLAGRRLGELEAFLPPIDSVAAVARGEQHWLTNYEEALAAAAKTNRPVLVNFTGYTCTNCRWMEANMFTRPEIASELSKFVLVELYTDGTDDMNRRYQQLEQDLFGTVALPYYAVLGPDGTPKVAFGGLTRSSDEYLNFLRY